MVASINALTDEAGKILVAGDDGHIWEVVRFPLDQAGHFAREAGTGDGTLAELEKTDFDLVILDIEMPRTDGLEVRRKAPRRGGAPMIFLSSKPRAVEGEPRDRACRTKPRPPQPLAYRSPASL